LNHSRGDFPHAERAADEVLSLPMFPELTAENMQAVAGAIQNAGANRL
jgi:dTDP-4-amino-4,6-dideoxygalactose transaminase